MRRSSISFVYFIFLIAFSFSFESLAQADWMDFQDQKKDEVMMLEGTWQFHFGDFLSAAEMDTIKKPLFVEVPSTWDEYEGGFPKTGIATYYTKVAINPSLGPLAINASITGLNYRLYANGQLIGELGKVGVDKDHSVPKYQNIIYSLPITEDTLRLVYQVSNFHYRKGGMWRAPIIGKIEVLKARKEKKLIIEFFLMGAIFFMGLYHLALNLFHRKNRLALYFGLVCLITTIRSASVGEFVLVEYLDWPWWLVTRIEFISFFLLISFMSRFLYYLFPQAIPKTVNIFPFYFGLSASLITTIVPIFYTSYLIPVAQLLTVLLGGYYLFIIGRVAHHGNKEARIAFLGLSVLFVASLFEILMLQTGISAQVVFSTGVFLYLFSHVIIISYRASKDYQKTELLSNALKSLNGELEQKVHERTRQLDKRNDELEKVNENLKLINAEKDGILHVVAHDLKSPLNTALSLGELLKNSGEIKNEQHLRYLKMLDHVNRQGLKFINDLLVLYQFEDAYKPDVTDVELIPLFQTIEDKFKQESIKKQIDFKIENNLAEGVVFRTDALMLTRVLDNLLSNAFKYSYSGSTVTLVYGISRDGKLHMQVADQGQGIPEKEHSKVFKKFQKISTRPTGEETSSGLGLSIVKQLIDVLNGTITFKSLEKKGTIFYFELPAL